MPGPPAESAGDAALRSLAGAVAGLDGLESIPAGSRVAAFERVHVALTDALAAIDGV